MPIYEYKCDKCGKVADKLVSRLQEQEGQTFRCDCDEQGTMYKQDTVARTGLNFRGNWFKTTGKY